MSGGNPLFLEAYSIVNTPAATISPRMNEALRWMISQITRDSRPLAQTLSVLKKSVELEAIARISGQNVPILEEQATALESIGLIERSGLGIRLVYPALATMIYRAIPLSKRLNLAKRACEVIRTTTYQPEDLAYYLFEAGMFKEAGGLYKQLGEAAYNQQNYRRAMVWHERLNECERRGGLHLLAADKLRLAVCYQYTGRQARARWAYKSLLAKDVVRMDPEALSALYARLANAFDKSSAHERVRRSRLAIECLPANSPQLNRRYVELCSNLLTAGDLSAATDALNRAKKYPTVSDKDSVLFHLVAGALLINRGDFRTAAESMLRGGDPLKSVSLINLALCFENLGDLRKALEFQSQAYKFGAENGILPHQIVSLANLGSIKMKLGEMNEAAHLFEEALALVEQSREKETAFDTARYITVQCDAALHSIQTGAYRRAGECLKGMRPSVGSIYELDRVYSRVLQCCVYREIGYTKRVRALLSRLQESQTFRTPFFQVEQTLLDAKMPDISSEEKLRRLQDALEVTHQLGTLYQQCQVLNELAAVLISTDEKRKALDYTRGALRLAKKQGYRLLATRALLLAGIASEKQNGKEPNCWRHFTAHRRWDFWSWLPKVPFISVCCILSPAI